MRIGLLGSQRRVRVGARCVAAAAAVALGAGGLAPGAAAAPDWAPRSTAKITPGVQMYTKGGQCTGNFVFTDAAGSVYVGYAAHCAGTGEATDTDGCDTKSMPVGTPVSFREHGSLLGDGDLVGTGELAYSSWKAMQVAGEKNADVCAYNDLALVKVDAGSVGKVNPTVPFFGGPNALSRTTPTTGSAIYSIGNSSLRGGIELLRPKIGFSLGADGNGWSQSGYTVTPGIPGDSGSGFLDADGNAQGVLSTLALAPLPASNGIGYLAKELDYARAHSGIDGLRLVPGEESFSPL
ncbi:hypothetical protein [Solicola gregarius]|uniref:Serine protease n=1 Tax=Solicola gregarius TaxID=2908642 RepID=A0AA46TIV1_9ACTN|nr:hypothetical protein [Solicola gregarius]UYM06106.1 hypothetical protein L0C25_03265 [Solicola gregarius]